MNIPRQRHPTMGQTCCRRRQGIQIRDERLIIKSHWTHAHVLLSSILGLYETSLSYLNRRAKYSVTFFSRFYLLYFHSPSFSLRHVVSCYPLNFSKTYTTLTRTQHICSVPRQSRPFFTRAVATREEKKTGN